MAHGEVCVCVRVEKGLATTMKVVCLQMGSGCGEPAAAGSVPKIYQTIYQRKSCCCIPFECVGHLKCSKRAVIIFNLL